MALTITDGYWTRAYDCVACQREHRADSDRRLFDDHIMRQSKHGTRDLYVPLLTRHALPPPRAILKEP